jgi:hypothetical protein
MVRADSNIEALGIRITQEIQILRSQRVLLDVDLAALYGVTTKALNQAVKRNSERFPEDFLFRLNRPEVDALNRSQTVTGSQRHRDPRYPPFAFTEHGAIMAATVLNSPRAVQMTVYVVRAFIRARELMSSHAQLAKELNSLKRSVAALDADTRRQFDVVHEAILGLMRPANSRQ